LSRHNDVADEAEEIAFARGVSEVAGGAQGGAHNLLCRAEMGAELGLILLEHTLVFPHVRDVARAEVAKARILCLPFVVFEGAEKNLMLGNGVVDLTL
jgi:hypothetical protein